MTMRHLIALEDLAPEEIAEAVDFGIEVKKNPGKYRNALAGRTLAMLFQKTSTRTRVSFEAAMTQLGGHAQYLDWRTTNFTLGSTDDEIRCMSRYVEAVMARVYRHEDVVAMARVSDIPVINGLSDREHPCQALGDLMTIREKKGGVRGVTLAYVGDGNNVCNSLIFGGLKAGCTVRVATPPGYKPDEGALEFGKRAGNRFMWTSVPEEAVASADAVYTDTWVSMGDEAEQEERLKVFPPYRVDANLMRRAAPDACFMHCLPVHRGCEATDEVIDGTQSVIYDQAENRLHIQKAILILMLTGGRDI